MDFLRPETWQEALAVKAERPDAVPIAGGTDVMVELNFDHRRPAALLDVTRIAPLASWERQGTAIRIGATVPYTRLIAELGAELPGLAIASRTVGSPQIRNRGTVAGNLGAASPAGDTHPILLAVGAVVEVESVRGTRLIPVTEFYLGVKRNALEPDELIRAVHVPIAQGPQQFSKIGTRNAMVIAVCSFGLAIDEVKRTVGTGVGSAAPTPRRALAAEDFAAQALPWESRDPLPPEVATRFGELAAQAASPIDDVRGS
ncbi:MAG TPA: carbon monoxide dehydrogenase, partial [Micromonosporaceae bacterium]|nr:carbon monoxide dehydrogenase [Micromonosporaceae bacterium]